VWILQHPGERRHPFGTAIIVQLALTNSRFDVVWDTEQEKFGDAAFPPGTALLFPGPTASDLSTMPTEKRPHTLVVLDGTWWGAKKLFNKNPALQRLPRVTLPLGVSPGHKLRREPAAGYLSTIEAVYASLKFLEPYTPNLDVLMAAYDRLCDGHLAERKSRHSSRYVDRSSHRTRRPPLDAETARRTVVLYGEVAPDKTGRKERALTSLAMMRLCDGALFHAFLQCPPDTLNEWHKGRMGLTDALLATAQSPEQVRTALRKWLGPDAYVTAWSQSTLDAAAPLLPAPPTTSLKTYYCNWRHRHAGDLSVVVEEEKLTVPTLEIPGRAAERLGMAVAVTTLLATPTDGGRPPEALVEFSNAEMKAPPQS